MGNKKKTKDVEFIYRIREMLSSKMHPNGKGQIYTSKKQCENHCRNMNMKRMTQEQKDGVEYKVISYEIYEVTRQYKIKNILGDSNENSEV